MHSSRTSPPRFRGVSTLLVAFAVGVGGLFAGASVAQADPNPKIVLSNATFTHTDANGKPVTGEQVFVRDFLEFKVDYDATNANPVPGDSFTVALPPALELRDEATKELKNAEGVVAGECVLTKAEVSTITCTFNEAIKNKSDVKGSLSANLFVSSTTDSAQVPVDLNGKIENVALPYDKPVVKRPSGWKPPTKPAKYVDGVNSKTTRFSWHIIAPGAWLIEKYGDKPVVISDPTTPGVLFPSTNMNDYSLVQRCMTDGGKGDATWEHVANASKDLEKGFTLKVEIADTHNLTFTATGPWKADCSYQFRVLTSFANGATIAKDYTYTNEATFVGTDTKVNAKRAYQETFVGTIEYRDGHGGLKFVKRVEGDDVAELADKAYTFSYTCSDGQSGDVKISQADGVKFVDAQFLKGTTCTVTETGGDRAGYTWAQPAQQTVTIVAGEATQVEFVNKYVKFKPVQPTLPVLNAGVCAAGETTPKQPTVTLPTTAGITYHLVELEVEDGVSKATVTATATEGYTLDAANLGPEWSFDAYTGVATWSASQPQGACSVVPVSPAIKAGVCEPGASAPKLPTVTVPNTTGLVYGEPKITVDGLKVTISLVATPERGFEIDGSKLPAGWVLNADGTAMFSVTEDQAKCAAVPVNPTVQVGVCKPGSTTPSDPVVTLPSVPGLTYSTPKVEMVDGKTMVTVMATADATRTIGELPTGWKLNADGTATFTTEVKVPKCSVKPGLPKTGD